MSRGAKRPSRRTKRRRARPGPGEAVGGARQLGGQLMSDIRRGDLRRSMRRDLRDIYEFYLDEERRDRLRRMGRIHRWFWTLGWVLKETILRLPPGRRVLLVLAFTLFVIGDARLTIGDNTFDWKGNFPAFVLLVLVLMLELKDKLLARDELEVGRAVQLALLPRDNPVVEGWETWLYTRPANDVGGDLVDYIVLDGGNVGVTLGDVSGKGLGAALLMAKLQATIRALATETAPLATLGARLNTIFCRDGVPERFATLVHAEYGPGSGVVRILNAGHPAPVLVEDPGGVASLDPVALPLGIMPAAVYEEQRIDMQPGSTLFIYSDGVSEAVNPAGELYGDERLLALLAATRALPAEAAGRRVLGAIQAWAADTPQSDDTSIIVIRRV